MLGETLIEVVRHADIEGAVSAAQEVHVASPKGGATWLTAAGVELDTGVGTRGIFKFPQDLRRSNRQIRSKSDDDPQISPSSARVRR
jgi:hypothetical protein